MGQPYSYLVPVQRDPGPEEYAKRAWDFLFGTGIIREYDEPDRPGWFNLGENSLVPFEKKEGYEYGFDFGNIFSGPHITIVPEDLNSIDPKCPKCQADMSGPMGEVYYPEDGTGADQIDFRDVRVTCPHCGGVFRPDELSEPKGIFLTDRYVCFVDPLIFRPEWVAEFDNHVGTPHLVASYWFV